MMSGMRRLESGPGLDLISQTAFSATTTKPDFIHSKPCEHGAGLLAAVRSTDTQGEISRSFPEIVG